MFFLLPIGVDYRARRFPVVTFTLMGLCTLVYLVTLSCEAFGDEDAVKEWVFQYLWLKPSVSHWWTYLTVMFVHAGFFHLLGNMIFLFLFGSCVEDIIGRTRFVIFYLLCGLAADFSYILVLPEHFASDIPMGGASGAISGCLGGFLLLFTGTKIRFKWVIFLFFRAWHGLFFWPAWLVISFWFLDDTANMIFSLMKDSHDGGVAFGAHVGGTVAGMVLIAIEKARVKSKGGFPVFVEDDEEEDVESLVRPAFRRPKPQPTPAPAVVEPATIYLSWNGANYGPYGPSQIRSMFLRGEIPAEATYWQHGMDEWRVAEELREPGAG